MTVTERAQALQAEAVRVMALPPLLIPAAARGLVRAQAALLVELSERLDALERKNNAGNGDRIG